MIEGFKVFEPLAGSFRFNAPVDEPRWSSMCVARSFELNQENEARISAPDVFLWYDNTLQPGLPALSKKLGHWLASIEIPNCSMVVDATLAVLAAKCACGVTLVKALDDLAGCLRRSDVSHFAPLKTNLASSWTTSLEWKGYHLGPLNLAKLVRRCQRAGSPLPSSVQSMLKGCPTIASPVFSRWLFDLRLFFLGAKNPSNASLFAHLEWSWFRLLHHEHWNMMWADFEERRALIFSLGYGLVEGDTFRKCPAIVEITCYLKIRDKPNDEGGVVFYDASHTIILPDLMESRAAIAAIESECDLASLEKSSLHGRLQSFSMTLNRGIRIGIEGHHSEAYVHFIIVLEQLFATGGIISQQVAARTAALVHRQLDMSFTDCRRKLQIEHYSARSKFVHNAIPVPPILFEMIGDVAQAVLRSLLWLAKRDESRSPDFFDQWIKRLDWIIAGYEAGITPPDDVLDANGIIAPDAFSLP